MRIVAGALLGLLVGVAAGLWLEQRYLRYGPFGQSVVLNPLVGHADGRFYPDNRGVWTLWAEGWSDAGEFYLGGRQIPTGLGRLSLQLGDFAREREVVLQRLRRLGIHSIDAPPEHVSVALLNRYLDIKRRELV